MKVIPAARIRLRQTSKGAKQKREIHKEKIKEKVMELPTPRETPRPIREMPTPILDDPIFTEDDDSEDETLQNQLDIVNREVISFIPTTTTTPPKLTLLDKVPSSSSSSPSSSTETDSDSSNAPLSVVAAKLASTKSVGRPRKRKLSDDSVIMAKKVIDYMKVQKPNGTKISYRDHFKLKANYIPQSISCSQILPKSPVNDTNENLTESLRIKAQKISKVNPKKRWLNGIDHMMNIHQPDKAKTRVPVLSKILSNVVDENRSEKCIEDCHVFKRTGNGKSWKPLSMPFTKLANTENRRAKLTIEKNLIVVNMGSKNSFKISLDKETRIGCTSPKFLQLNNSAISYGNMKTTSYGFGFSSEKKCKKFQELLENATDAAVTQFYKDTESSNKDQANKDETIKKLKTKITKLKANFEKSEESESQLKKLNQELATKNDALENEVTKMRNLLHAASQELKEHESNQRTLPPAHLIPLLKEAKKYMDKLVNEIGVDGFTKTELVSDQAE